MRRHLLNRVLPLYSFTNLGNWNETSWGKAFEKQKVFTKWKCVSFPSPRLWNARLNPKAYLQARLVHSCRRIASWVYSAQRKEQERNEKKRCHKRCATIFCRKQQNHLDSQYLRWLQAGIRLDEHGIRVAVSQILSCASKPRTRVLLFWRKI